ncbi:MAG: TrkA C-terminal domain-containing protein [candidate division Zixibacteria bacterium]|nr:TrkA C-terminal domain-containing protein [candidate division Zixibacteria bacterium]
MSGSFLLLPTLLVILFSFLIVRAAAIALMMTGMEEKRAKFQALSAFSGTGFTTKEAESVVSHPKRRKIVTWLMILGNAGVVTVIVTGTSSLVSSKGYQLPINVVLLVVGIFIVYKVATHKGFIRRWESYIEDRLTKSRPLEEGSTEDLLHLAEGFGLVKAIIKEGSPIIGNSLSQCELSSRGLLVLGIEREKRWIPVPGAEETIKEHDKLLVYGSLEIIKEIFR